MTEAQSQVSGDLVICRRTVGGSSKSEYGTRYYVYEEVAPYKEPPEVSEDDLLDAIIETFYGGSKIEGMGDAILRHNLTSRVRVFRANFSISRRVGGGVER